MRQTMRQGVQTPEPGAKWIRVSPKLQMESSVFRPLCRISRSIRRLSTPAQQAAAGRVIQRRWSNRIVCHFAALPILQKLPARIGPRARYSCPRLQLIAQIKPKFEIRAFLAVYCSAALSKEGGTAPFSAPQCVAVPNVDSGRSRLCCTNPVRDSFRESSVVAGLHEQTDTPDLQDQELAVLQ